MIQSKPDSERSPLEWLELKHLGWRAKHARNMSDVYVEGEGADRKPPIMIIGEAPGSEEQLRKRPFVGPSGRVLRQLMETAGIFTGFAPHFGEPNCWLTNTVKFRPSTNNRAPFQHEIDSVRPLLRAEWKIIGRPRIIIPVGGVALYALVGKQVSILKHSGWVHTERSRLDGGKMWVWPMIHPAYALRNKQYQPLLEQDWEKLGRWLNGRN